MRKPFALMLVVRVALSRLGRWIISISLWMNRFLSIWSE